MKYMVEEDLSNFRFWSGAKDRAKELTSSQLDAIGEALDNFYADDEELPTDTTINDLFWFEFPWVCSLIGLRVDDGDNPIEDPEEWARDILEEAKRPVDIYFDDFWYDWYKDSDEVLSEDKLIKDFDEYVSDNWLDHANDVLEERFPDADEELRDTFACEQWQNCASDDENCQNFEIFLSHN